MELDAKTQHLISIAVAMALNSREAFDYHIKKMAPTGNSKKEIADTVRMVRDMKIMITSELLEHAGRTLGEDILIPGRGTGANQKRTSCC